MYTLLDGNGDKVKSGLTAQEVTREIYTDDGQGYRLEPSLDDDGNQLVCETLGLVWDIYFTKAGQATGTLARFNAYGETEEAAENSFLMEQFKSKAWDKRWLVMGDADCLEMLKDAENAES